jgi:hypothetical protein
MSRIRHSEVHLYLGLDDEYHGYRNIIEDYAKDLFPNIQIYGQRLYRYSDWLESLNTISKESNLILLQNNFDHFFVSNQVFKFEKFCKFLANRRENALGVITHWQEFMGDSNWRKIDSDPDINVFTRQTNETIGTTLITKDFFESWWHQDFTQGHPIVRPDNPFGPNVTFPPVNEYLPSEEFFRHSDGYGHIDLSDVYASPIRPCCQFKNGKIKHIDWQYGIVKNSRRLIPTQKSTSYSMLPSFLQFKSSKREYLLTEIEKVLSGTSFKFGFSNIFNILSTQNRFVLKFVVCAIALHPKRMDKVLEFYLEKFQIRRRNYLLKSFVLEILKNRRGHGPTY